MSKPKKIDRTSKLATDLFLRSAQQSVGRCPRCGRWPIWFNDVPLRAYCWGPEEKEHKEWSRVMRGEHQPYK